MYLQISESLPLEDAEFEDDEFGAKLSRINVIRSNSRFILSICSEANG